MQERAVRAGKSEPSTPKTAIVPPALLKSSSLVSAMGKDGEVEVMVNSK
jgi:hypothetical protein